MKLRSPAFSSVLLAFCFSLSAFTSPAQQALTYTQYMNNGSPYNSAYSLINKAADINLSGRLQWVGIDGAPTSYLLNGKLPFESIDASAGLIIRQDKFSVERETEMIVFFAKAVQLNSGAYLAASVNGGFQNYKANYSQLDATDPLFRDDIVEGSGIVGAGIMTYAPDKYYIGISLPRLNLKNMSKTSRRMGSTCYFSAGSLHELDDKIIIKPAILVSYVKNIPLTADISTTFYFGTLGIGANYRTTNEIAGILSYQGNNFRIGYSYQSGINNKTIGGMSNGTHELTFGVLLRKGSAKIQL